MFAYSNKNASLYKMTTPMFPSSYIINNRLFFIYLDIHDTRRFSTFVNSWNDSATRLGVRSVQKIRRRKNEFWGVSVGEEVKNGRKWDAIWLLVHTVYYHVMIPIHLFSPSKYFVWMKKWRNIWILVEWNFEWLSFCESR